MEKRYYTAESLEEQLRAYEARYDLPSARLIAAYEAGELPHGVPGFEAAVWADTYRECERLHALEPQPA